VATKVRNLGLKFRVGSPFLLQALKFFHHSTPLSIAKQRSMFQVKRSPLLFGKRQRGQRQRDVMHRVAAVQDLVGCHPLQLRQLDDRSDAIPNPRRAVGDKANTLGLGRTETVKVHRDNLCDRIWAKQSSVNRCLGLLAHFALIVVDKDCHQLWFTPIRRVAPLGDFA